MMDEAIRIVEQAFKMIVAKIVHPDPPFIPQLTVAGILTLSPL